jgi:hypothetical protein
MLVNTTGCNSVAIGSLALDANTEGNLNTAVGYSALSANTTASDNTGIGHFALANATTGCRNTALGRTAGSTVTTGINLTLLGHDAEPSSATATNEVTLGDTNVTIVRNQGSILFPQSGRGIYLGTTTAVAANLLDDYEEGTFTPEIADASSGGNVASALAVSGRYRKIGAVVHYNILFININTTGLTSGNTVYIRGFPFTTQSIGSGEMNSIVGVNSASLTTGCVTLNLGSNITYGTVANQTTSGQAFFLVSQLTSGASDFFIQGTYFTA